MTRPCPLCVNAAPTDKELHMPRMLNSLLIPVDLSPASDRVVGRVARLPLAEGAQLTLLHVASSSLAPREQRIAERDAKQLLSEEARHLGASLPKA